MRTATFLAALVTLGAGVASAQSSPITRPKALAQKAVDATNRHTAAMTAMPVDSAPAAQGAAPRDSSGRATTDASGRETQTAAGSTAVRTPEPAFQRETFRYERSGRRDPFVSLMNSDDLRPLITELRVTSIAYSEKGGSVAILRDLGTKEQYRVRVGESLGRMRVSKISPRAIVFTIEEFGFSRQETLALNDPNKESLQ